MFASVSVRTHRRFRIVSFYAVQNWNQSWELFLHAHGHAVHLEEDYQAGRAACGLCVCWCVYNIFWELCEIQDDKVCVSTFVRSGHGVVFSLCSLFAPSNALLVARPA